ncbi:Sarcosine dehydrogenase, mitochondrial, partial [Lemmus lemmus]
HGTARWQPPGWQLSSRPLPEDSPSIPAVLQDVLDADLSNEAFPFSTHQLVKAAGHLAYHPCLHLPTAETTSV